MVIPKLFLKGKISQDVKELCFTALLQTFWAWFSYLQRSNVTCPTLWCICTRLANTTSDLWETSAVLRQTRYPRESQKVAVDFRCVHISVLAQSIIVLLKWISRSSPLWFCTVVLSRSAQTGFLSAENEMHITGTPPANGYSIRS